MPQVNDSSDYTRRLKLRAISFGNQEADPRKFRVPNGCNARVPTRCGIGSLVSSANTSYDPSVFRNKGGVCNDLCLTPKHNIANLMRLPYKNPALGDRYGSFGGGDPIVQIAAVGPTTLDFSTSNKTPDGNDYKIATTSQPSTSITFIIRNPGDKLDGIEFDSDTFEFETDGSTISINGVLQNVEYNAPYYSEFCVFTNETTPVDGDEVTLTTNSPISGKIFIGTA